MKETRDKIDINALTSFIQEYPSSYLSLGKKLQSCINKLDIPYSIWEDLTDSQIKIRMTRLAHGTKPSPDELHALALIKFRDASQWTKLYFPNKEETYKFIVKTYQTEVNKIFLSEEKTSIFDSKKSKYTKVNIRNGITRYKITPTELTYKILGLLNFKMADEIQLGHQPTKCNFKEFCIKWVKNNLSPNAPLVKDLMDELRNTLDIDRNNKKELKQVVLRGLISVL